MQIVILAGGKGTRLGHLTQSVPKPMVHLAGKPIMEYEIELARENGFTDLLILTGHLGEVIENHYRDGRDWGVSIQYHREQTPLGTAGALKEVEDRLADDFIICYGDMVMNIDLGELARFHLDHQSLATVVVHPNNHPEESDLVELDATGKILAMHAKPHPVDRYFRNCANAALCVASRRLLQFIPKGQPADMGRDILPEVVRNGQTLWGYDTAEYIEDVGTPLRLQETERDMLSGKIARLNRKNPRGAVFLRQINVLTTDIQPEAPVESLQLLPHVAEAVHQINVSEYLTFVLSDLQEPVASNVADEPRPTNGQPENRPQISDQPIINNVDINNALGYAKFDTLLGAKRAFVDHIYDGLSSATKNACISALLGQAAADWNVDLEQSWMIGCRLTDLEVAARSGCRTILLRNGRAPFDARDRKNLYRPDFICNDLAQAVPLLLQNEKAPLS